MIGRILNRNNGHQNIILLATDGSKPALMATKKAVDLAKATGAVLHVLYVEEESLITPLERMDEDVAEEEYGIMHSKGHEVAEEWARSNGVTTVIKMYPSGPIVGAILSYAREIKPGFIVIGSAGRSGWERLTLGSVAEGVMKHSQYPVVMTKGYDDEYISDILKIALTKIRPEFPEEPFVEEVPIESLMIRKKLGIAFGTLLAFLIPYFGLGAMTSFAKDIATSTFWGSANVAVVWIILLFPIGWLTAIFFNRVARRMEDSP